MRDPKNRIKGFSLFELITAACIIFVLMGTFAAYADRALKVAKDMALQNELVGIRMAIQHYLIINNRLPRDLDELLKKSLTIKNPDGTVTYGSYLKAVLVGKDGSLLDPFQNKYNYDSISGLVWSQTPGCENW